MTIAPKLIIGLGNPDLPADRHGKEYQNTYHNVGFLFIDGLFKIAAAGELRQGQENLKFKILKSQVYMNKSGSFVAKELKKSGMKPDELLLVHDDSDLEIGKYKLSFGRGAAGHHGVESVITSLKTKNFWRLRIGIRPPEKKSIPVGMTGKRLKAEKFVLKKISKTHSEILGEAFSKIISELRLN